MSEKYYKVSSEDLYSLLYDRAVLECLEAYGVDNWEGYGGWDQYEIDTSIMEILDDLQEIKND